MGFYRGKSSFGNFKSSDSGPQMHRNDLAPNRISSKYNDVNS